MITFFAAVQLGAFDYSPLVSAFGKGTLVMVLIIVFLGVLRFFVEDFVTRKLRERREREVTAKKIGSGGHQIGERSNDAAPHCPVCNRVMVVRTARQGTNAGSDFWGCPAYPKCRGTR